MSQLSSVRDSLQTLLPGHVVVSGQLDEAGDASTQPDKRGYAAPEEPVDEQTAAFDAVSGSEPAEDGTSVGGAAGAEEVHARPGEPNR